MKKYLFPFLLIVLAFTSAYSQKREKEAHYYYLSLGTSVYTNTPGTFNQKMFVTAEFGRTYGIFDIGLQFARLNLVRNHGGRDTSWSVEVLPTINVFSKGRFSEALTLGAGYVFNARRNFVTEITNSINFAPNNQMVLTVYQGNYFFDGKYSTFKTQFMGLSLTFNFIKKDTNTDELKRKSLLN